MTQTYDGSCHCGDIRFEADVDLGEGIRKCNCSFCWKLGYQKTLVPYDAVRIVAGKDTMRDYRATPSAWPEGDVNHYFCPACGAHTFSRGFLEMMDGNFWAVNVACLADVSEEELANAPVIYEDGRDRQDSAPEIAAYS